LRKPFFVPVTAAAAVVAVVVIALVVQNLGSNDPGVSTQPSGPGVQQYALGSVPDGYKADPVQSAFHQESGSTTKNNPEQQAPSAVCRQTSGEGADRVCTDVIGAAVRTYHLSTNPKKLLMVATGYNVLIPEGSRRPPKAPPLDVTVRGKSGRYVAWDTTEDSQPLVEEVLSWTERPGVVMQLGHIGLVNGADDVVALAEDLRAQPLSFDEAPRAVASGDLHSQDPPKEQQRWYLSIGHWHDKGYCMTVSALPAESGGSSPDGVLCADQPPAAALFVPRDTQLSDALSSVMSGTAGTGVARVRVTPEGGRPIEVDVVGRNEGLGLGLWAVQLPQAANYAVVALDGSGHPIGGEVPVGTVDGTPAVSPMVKGPTVELGAGDDAKGHWKVLAAPSTTGLCFGIGYGEPKLSACYATSVGEVLTDTAQPDLVIGVVSAKTAKVRVTFAKHTTVEANVPPSRSDLGIGGLRVFGVAKPLKVHGEETRAEAFDAAGKKLGDLTFVTGGPNFLPAPASTP
jgi:hypothetical protein